MNLRMLILLFLLVLGQTGVAQTYEELSQELKAATANPAIHRLKAQLADAGVQRLES